MQSPPIKLKVEGKAIGQEKVSCLAFLMQITEAAGALAISFEDLVGVTYDHPELWLPDDMRMHTGPFCLWAKSHVRTSRGLPACSINKYLANRRVRQLNGRNIGQCHLGLTDICQPLVYRQQILGIFYYGSVVLQEHQKGLEERLMSICQEHRLDKAEALEALKKVPVISARELSVYQGRLDKLCETITMMLDGLGLPADCYHPHNRAKEARIAMDGPPRLVVQATRLIATYLDNPLTLSSIARRLNCHPKYLSRIFQRSMGMSIADFLTNMRIERASSLLKIGRLDVTRIAYEVGYTDKSNFSRSFRKVMGMTPGQYRRQFHPAEDKQKVPD